MGPATSAGGLADLKASPRAADKEVKTEAKAGSIRAMAFFPRFG
jgi:hypothetical protein